MKSKGKVLALVLLFSVLISMLGCTVIPGGNTADPQTGGNATNDTSGAVEQTKGFQTTFGSRNFGDTTITVEVFDRSNAPEGSTVVDNKWVDYINESMGKVGIKVQFVAVPRSEEVSKVQLMMASGTGPDLMLSYTSAVVEGFYNDGGTVDLAPYIDGADQAKNLKEYISEQCLNVGRNAQNELWGVAAKRSTTARQNLFIRKDWLNALGLAIPTTVDELYHVLDQFKNNNPEGKTNVIASSFATCNSGYPAGVMSYAFMKSVMDETTFNINSGSTTDLIYTDDGFAEYMRFMNKLYNNGLIDTEYYVNNDFGQTVKEYFVNGQLGCFEEGVNYNVDNLRGSLLQNLKASNPNAEFISISPMKNVNGGKVYNNGYPVNGAFVFVPKTCKNVEAAVTYLDWMATKEGGFAIFHGFEGEHFKYDDAGTPCIIDTQYNAADKDWTRHDLFLVGNQGYYQTTEEFAKATSKELPGYEQYVLNNYENATVGIVKNETTFTAPTYTKMNAEISLIQDESHPQYPQLDDFGDCMLVADNGASGYFRVDWFTPDGLSNWGDGRTFILGTEGFIELRKNMNLGDNTGSRVLLANHKEETSFNVRGKAGYPFFGQLILDCLNRTETAMTQEHAFKAAELCVRAQLMAEKLK